jgi:hypothetical protein
MKKIRLFAFLAALAMFAGCADMPTAPQADENEDEGRSWVGPVGSG